MLFDPTRAAGLSRLNDFAPKAGRAYAANRNADIPGHPHVSMLSPYLRHRLITEDEVLGHVLSEHTPDAAQKFIQEVYWRTYWKGWLEMRPSVWTTYRAGVNQAWNRVQTESGLRSEFEAACRGETEIECFNHWAQELVSKGYIHNHARMWFASIWIFTLRLPWELGADFFLRHLLDGDPASNTLGWRWVAGLQTPGKTYLARHSNIAKFTEGRFRPDPSDLAAHAPPVDGMPNPDRTDLPGGDDWDKNARSGLLLTEDDLAPEFLFDDGFSPLVMAAMTCASARSQLAVADPVLSFTEGAITSTLERLQDRLADIRETPFTPEDTAGIVDWAVEHDLTHLVTPYAPVGPAAEALDVLESKLKDVGIALKRPQRSYDRRAWPNATAGFFKFKDKIPKFLRDINSVET